LGCVSQARLEANGEAREREARERGKALVRTYLFCFYYHQVLPVSVTDATISEIHRCSDHELSIWLFPLYHVQPLHFFNFKVIDKKITLAL
jgi:hypothetical protein